MHANKTKFERNSALTVRVLLLFLLKKKKNIQAKVVYCLLGWLFDAYLHCVSCERAR